MITKRELINEVTSTYSDGRFYSKLTFAPMKWEKKNLSPFEIPVQEYSNAELAHDEMDGELSVSKERAQSIEKKTEQLSNKMKELREQESLTKKDIENLVREIINEDLRVWFGTKKKPKGSTQPKGPWVNICRKDENGKHPPCGRKKAEDKAYPKCRAAGVASKMSDAQKKAACQQKRRAEKTHDKSGKGNKPKMVSHKK
jgi:hypothetical protein